MMAVLVAGCLRGVLSQGCSECVFVMQVELFEATAQKKEASANLRMVSFLEKEVCVCRTLYYFFFFRYHEHSYFIVLYPGFIFELSFPKTGEIHERLRINNPFGIFYFPW